MTRSPVAITSPCVDVCAIEPSTGWCEGCLRTLDEIAAWGSVDERARREIWKRLPVRRRERDDARAAAGSPAPASASAPASAVASAVAFVKPADE